MNNIINDTKKAKRLEHFVFVVIVAVLLTFSSLIGEILNTVLTQIFPQITGTAFGSSLSLVLGFLPSIIFVLLWVKYFQKRKISSLGLYKKGALKQYLLGSGIGILMFSSIMVVLYATGNASIEKVYGMSALFGILVLMPGWMIQTASEEIVSRGYLFSTISAKHNIYLAGFLSAALFTALHLMNPGVSEIAVINIFLVGILFCLTVVYHQNLWVAFGIHFTWNFFQGTFYGLPVSGVNINSAQLVSTKLNPAGNTLLTGGSFGPEAGILATIVIVFVSGIYLYLIQKNRKNNTEEKMA